MTRKMVVNAVDPEEVRIALLDNARLIDFDIETRGSQTNTGNIYKAKIVDVEPSLNAAFVDYGADKQGFLTANDVNPRAAGHADDADLDKNASISDLLKPGQEILVQVTKDEVGAKGAVLTTYLALAGRYVVAMPNPRGSIGYGQAFTDAVTRDWGGAPYQDVMSFTEAVASKRWVDGKKACAAGASYGGYMVNWIAGQTTRFSCLISHAGLFDLAAFWGDTEELWFPEWEFGAPPYQDRSLYDRWSPSRHVKSMKTPTMVIHGQLDYRVDLSHGLSMFTALRRRGVPSRLVYFPDEGHWITDPNNFVYWFSEMHGWLRRHLKGQR